MYYYLLWIAEYSLFYSFPAPLFSLFFSISSNSFNIIIEIQKILKLNLESSYLFPFYKWGFIFNFNLYLMKLNLYLYEYNEGEYKEGSTPKEEIRWWWILRLILKEEGMRFDKQMPKKAQKAATASRKVI